MAGEWLKFDCTLPEKQETLAITAAMGWDDPDTTVGKLMRLFRWFDQQTVDGNARGVTPALLDRVMGVSGFVSAVVSVGWIVVDERGLSLSNFDRHNGATAKSRVLTAKRVAHHKANATGNAKANAGSVSGALPKGEKSREEKSKEEEGEEEAPVGAPPPSMAGAICVAMKSVGLASVNPSHPDLRVLIESGAEIGVFVDAAREAVAKQKPFSYVLAMVKGRMADAAVLASAALAAPGLTGNTALNKQELLEAGNMAAARRFAERAR